jgi:hypothetical protein
MSATIKTTVETVHGIELVVPARLGSRQAAILAALDERGADSTHGFMPVRYSGRGANAHNGAVFGCMVDFFNTLIALNPGKLVRGRFGKLGGHGFALAHTEAAQKALGEMIAKGEADALKSAGSLGFLTEAQRAHLVKNMVRNGDVHGLQKHGFYDQLTPDQLVALDCVLGVVAV